MRSGARRPSPHRAWLARALVLALAAAGCTSRGCGQGRRAPAAPVALPIAERPLADHGIAPRNMFGATTLSDGRIFAVGGWGKRQGADGKVVADELADALVYQPGADRWTRRAEMARARLRHTATALTDGRVLVVGGLNRKRDAAGTAELYDPAADSWRPAPPPASGRDGHQALRLPGGQVLIVGGLTGSAGDPTTAETFDPATGTWAPAGRLPAQIYGHAAVLLPDGRVLVTGGSTVGAGVTPRTHLYDPKTRRWAPAADLKRARYGHTATVLPSGAVLVTGGWHGKDLDSVEEYDVAANSWREREPLLAARDTHLAAMLGNDLLLVVGGQNASVVEAGFYLTGTALMTAEVYDIGRGTFRPAGQLRSPHSYAAALRAGDAVLVFGGLNDPRTLADDAAMKTLSYALVRPPTPGAGPATDR